MMAEWDARLYDGAHGFVSRLGAPLIDLLDPKPGERILDVGCGTGSLSAEIAAKGAEVLGIDASLQMVEAARSAFPGVAFQQVDACDYGAETLFDGVFSNAALHWIKPPEQAARMMAKALKPGGRLVLEMGGRGNVAKIEAALLIVGGLLESPWYFPSLAEYSGLLESVGFEVTYACLFDRPTPLQGPDGLKNWVRMFGSAIGMSFRPEELERVEEMLRQVLWDGEEWIADYRRLRVVARRSDRGNQEVMRQAGSPAV